VTFICLLVAGLVVLITSQLKPADLAPPSPVGKPSGVSVPKKDSKARRSQGCRRRCGAVLAAFLGPAKKRLRPGKKDAATADDPTAEPGAAGESKKGAADPAKSAEPEEPIDITSRPPSLRQPPKKQ
jgi:hypothetical protein